MGINIQIAANAVVAKVYTDDRNILNFINEKLSYTVAGSDFMTAYKSFGWSGKSSFFNFSSKTFPAGFLHLITKELTLAGHSVNMIKKPLPEPLGEENPIVDEFGNDNPDYDYQMQALRQVEKHGRGIIRVATGGGKSKIAKLIISRFKRMTLFITTRGVLMYQMKESAESGKIKTGVVGDGIFSPVRGLNVAMVQTLVAKLQEPDINAEIMDLLKKQASLPAGVKPLSRKEITKQANSIFEYKAAERRKIIKLLEMFEVVIGEEAHEASGNSYYEILKHCKNAHIRVALTATPFMKDNMEDNMRLMAAFGPILIDVSEELLIKRGILATPYFLYAKSNPHPKIRKTSPYQRARQLGIVESEDRNNKIVHFVEKAKNHGLSSMILVQMKKHGSVLLELMEKKGIKAVFIQGEDDNPERKKALNKLKNREIDAIIGTTILDVGVDVPAVGFIAIAGGGKAEVALRQRIGRGLRKKKDTANIAFILDFSDQINVHLRDHSRQRLNIIQSTPGFAENIVVGSDFDWTLLAKK